MEDEASNPNVEWKKTGFESKDKITLKTNVKKALEYEAKDKRNPQNSFAISPSELPKGLNKMRKKIKDIYDEDDEDENDFIIAPLEQSSLLNALHDNEKTQLKTQETIKNMQMQQNAGKMEALMTANRMTQQLGLKGLSKDTVNKNFQDVAMSSNTYERALKDDITKKMKLKGRNLSEKEMVNLLRGIKRVQEMSPNAEGQKNKGKMLEGWKLDDLLSAGEKGTDDKEVAEMILKKSGRKSSKKEVTVVKTGNTNLKSSKNELLINKDLMRE